MYGYFYPENNERFLSSMGFATAEDAIFWFRDRRPTWQRIGPIGKDDLAAFMNPLLGDIVVVRALGDQPAGEG
jgi:hypothetical protein